MTMNPIIYAILNISSTISWAEQNSYIINAIHKQTHTFYTSGGDPIDLNQLLSMVQNTPQEDSITLFTKIEQFPIKIIIALEQGDVRVSLFPLEPYIKRTFKTSHNQEKLDLSAYIHFLLNICDNFALFKVYADQNS